MLYPSLVPQRGSGGILVALMAPFEWAQAQLYYVGLTRWFNSFSG